jgi:histidyl-tRNA synthetase
MQSSISARISMAIRSRWRFIEDNARRIFSIYGYSEIRTPLIEETRLFARSVGEDTDIVKKQMYAFKDQGERDICLRPEETASVVRAYLENNLDKLDGFVKLFYIGPMFRRERPQKGRYRQFYQIDAEVFGVDNPMVDAEVIVMLIHFLKRVGLEKLELQINTLGDRVCRPRYREELKKFLEKKSILSLSFRKVGLLR